MGKYFVMSLKFNKSVLLLILVLNLTEKNMLLILMLIRYG